jgi:hypothetical protein
MHKIVHQANARIVKIIVNQQLIIDTCALLKMTWLKTSGFTKGIFG